MWRSAVLVLLTGCGLTLDTDGGADTGDTGGDGAVPDARVPDARLPDADGATDALPVVSSGQFENGMAVLRAGVGAEQRTTLPWAVRTLKFHFSTTMDEPLLDATLWGISGEVLTTSRLSAAPDATILGLSTTNSGVDSGLPNGWYCIRIASTPSTAGVNLDGEWLTGTSPGEFPSGDGTAGGDFVYAFAVVEGDLDGDGDSDFDDISILEPLPSDPRADLNGDGVVGSADVSILSAAFGNNLMDYGVPTQCALDVPSP